MTFQGERVRATEQALLRLTTQCFYPPPACGVRVSGLLSVPGRWSIQAALFCLSDHLSSGRPCGDPRLEPPVVRSSGVRGLGADSM